MKVNRASAMCLLLLALPACSDDPLVPSMSELSGTYEATGISILTASGAENGLVGGGSIVLTLEAGGSTSGHAYLPYSGDDGAIDVDLDGTWALTDGVLRLDFEADIFLRDMPLSSVAGRLVGHGVFGDEQIFVVFDRVP